MLKNHLLLIRTKITTIFVLIFLLFTFSSCNFGLKVFYGLKKPKIETEKSLKKYLKRKNINSDNIYTVDFNDYVYTVKIIRGFPEVMIFSSNNKLIKYREDTACNGAAFSYIENLSIDTEFQYIDSVKLDDYLSKLKDFSGKPVKIGKSEDTDFYLFIFWTRYTGRLNKNHVKIWEEDANNNSKAKIKVIKVNLDKQEWWKTDLNYTKPNFPAN